MTDVDELSFDAWDALSIVEWFQADPGAPVPASCKLLDYKYAHDNPGAWMQIRPGDLPDGINPETARVLMATEAQVEEGRSLWTESRHPGHANQKVHGGGGKGAAKLPEGVSTSTTGKLDSAVDKLQASDPKKYWQVAKTHEGAKPYDIAGPDGKTAGHFALYEKDGGKSVDIGTVVALPGSKGIVKSTMDATDKLHPNAKQTLDCFDGHLPTIYAKHGFKEVDRIKWDDQYAPDNWKPEYGRPDVVFMARPSAKERGVEGRTERRFSVVTREVDRVGDNCPECQANSDPNKIPVHPGCNCDAKTTEVETGVDPTDLPDLRDIVADANTAAALPLQGMRYGDFLRWAEQISNDLGDLEAITAVLDEEADTFWALVSTVVEDEFSFEDDSAFLLDAIGDKTVGRLAPGTTAGLRDMFDKLMEGRH